DVNVHPTKMELRFQRQQDVYNTVFEGVHRRLLEPELIQKTEVPEPVQSNEKNVKDAPDSAGQKESPFLLRPRNTAMEIRHEDIRNVGAKSADAIDVKPEDVKAKAV